MVHWLRRMMAAAVVAVSLCAGLAPAADAEQGSGPQSGTQTASVYIRNNTNCTLVRERYGLYYHNVFWGKEPPARLGPYDEADFWAYQSTRVAGYVHYRTENCSEWKENLKAQFEFDHLKGRDPIYSFLKTSPEFFEDVGGYTTNYKRVKSGDNSEVEVYYHLDT
ncbi:hypothetical protein JW613_31200 [Streptomyces smyrnaeus]|uniref:Secreted protein n=1 Tax=Streptomyces smyrnaeus TaxID=1387713 RepID=A0ABS3Y4W7_9ACTN|nr:hypothetical protein [Streptomyces smyrnaeus]MBO8202709.1 hypothetical protein [Streptomyces smyrnaeus]